MYACSVTEQFLGGADRLAADPQGTDPPSLRAKRGNLVAQKRFGRTRSPRRSLRPPLAMTDTAIAEKN